MIDRSLWSDASNVRQPGGLRSCTGPVWIGEEGTCRSCHKTSRTESDLTGRCTLMSRLDPVQNRMQRACPTCCGPVGPLMDECLQQLLG